MFFLINFTTAALLALAGLVAFTGSDPYDSAAGLVMLLPTGIYAIAEWLAFYRGNRRTERRLGWVNTFGGAFFAFGAVANGVEALQDSKVSLAFLGVVLTIFLAIAAYLFWCGLARLSFTADLSRPSRTRAAASANHR